MEHSRRPGRTLRRARSYDRAPHERAVVELIAVLAIGLARQRLASAHIVSSAAHQRMLAGPRGPGASPAHPTERRRLRFELGGSPSIAAVSAEFDRADDARARPGKAADL